MLKLTNEEATIAKSGSTSFEATSSKTGDVIISNVRIIDVALETVSAPKTILIENGAIKRIEAFSPKAPLARNSIDAGGAFAMPGMFDMHVHLTGSIAAAGQMGPLYVANGVTSVRELWSGCWKPCGPGEYSLSDYQTVVAKFDTGALIGPRVRSLSSPLVHGAIRLRMPPDQSDESSDEPFYPPKTKADGRMLADWAKETGYNEIKVYNSVPREAYFGITERAKEIGITVMGHLPRAVQFEEAIKAGQRTFEHARAPAVGCSHFAEKLSTLADDIIMERSRWSIRGRVTSHLSEIMEGYDPERCKRLFALLKEYNAYLTPTHVTRAFDAGATKKDFVEDSRLRYIPSMIQLGWFDDVVSTRIIVEQISPPYDEFYQHGLKITKLAYDAGVSIMVGSDAGDSYIFPGFSLHDELEALVKVGVSEGDVLRSATIVPAEYLGLDPINIAEGNTADIVLMSSNPLDDITATRQIEGVLLRGRFFNRDDLDHMLTKSEKLASSPKFNLSMMLELIQ
ncbi:MAG: amidohydrolase family protein [Pseudomonadota bacterium]